MAKAVAGRSVASLAFRRVTVRERSVDSENVGREDSAPKSNLHPEGGRTAKADLDPFAGRQDRAESGGGPAQRDL